MDKKIDNLIYKLSDEIKCELCDNSFKVHKSLEFPFRTIKLCSSCMLKNIDDVNSYVFEFTENGWHKLYVYKAKGKEFEGEYLTWKHIKDFLNQFSDDSILDYPVVCQEHHHYTFIRCNPVIQIRLSDDLKMMIEDNELNGDDLRSQYEKFLNQEKNDPDKDYYLEHPSQFNLSLMI